MQINRCLMREVPGDGNSPQCMAIAGHRGSCIFRDGQAELDAAAAGKLCVAVAGDVGALGILVVPVHDVRKEPDIFPAMAKARVVILHDTRGEVGVFKNTVSVGFHLRISHGNTADVGLEAVVQAVRDAGGEVRFGVGCITIANPRAE